MARLRCNPDLRAKHRQLVAQGSIEAIGVDELSRRRGQRYLTLVYQLDGHCKLGDLPEPELTHRFC